ncbi:proteasome accessory factor C [Microbacterium endophyticum]|uniref:Proteasome accessory factor C n=1 Tax=Microbacterium endophyticum TaxID=1526412 RepID=A0A7W4V568_9MICO|nr:WYL domain-containing protein [Microbacterium endophyticum]MBB2976729.1 proteasome accessory factor C [Microbacterium endophyticum]NIK36635.1 proteasome accessory factor C [Microbacterium endophyticum]
MTVNKPLLALDRAALMMQLVPYLIGRGEVSVTEAARDFDVTPDLMRGMVEKLTVIGLPGDGGFWQLPHDLFDIDWDLLDAHDIISITNTVGLEHAPRLTAREAAALLAGLQLARTLPGVSDSGIVQDLLSKLSRGASSTPAEVIVAPGPVDDARDVVDQALKTAVAVSFTYKAPDAATTIRTVDPVKVHIAGGQWYLQGWCHLRQSMRTFHLDRVRDIELTSIPITHGEEPVPALFAPSDDDVVVEVKYPSVMAPLLGGYIDRAQVSVVGDKAIATLRVADEQSMKRLAARGGGEIEVLSPVSARDSAAAWAQSGLEQYAARDSR